MVLVDPCDRNYIYMGSTAKNAKKWAFCAGSVLIDHGKQTLELLTRLKMKYRSPSAWWRVSAMVDPLPRWERLDGSVARWAELGAPTVAQSVAQVVGSREAPLVDH